MPHALYMGKFPHSSILAESLSPGMQVPLLKDIYAVLEARAQAQGKTIAHVAAEGLRSFVL